MHPPGGTLLTARIHLRTMHAQAGDAEPSTGHDPGVVLVGALAVFLGAAYLGYLAVAEFPRTDVAAWKRLLQAGFGVALPTGLLAGARWLDGADLDRSAVWGAAMWTLGGLSALTLLTAWKFYVDSLGSGLGPQPFETLVLNAQAGAVAGLLVGVHDARARRNAEHFATARDQHRLLNQLLRHNILNSVQLVDSYVAAYRQGGAEEAAMLDTVQSQCEAIEGLVEKARTLEHSTVDGGALQPIDVVAAVERQVSVFSSSYPDASFETELPASATAVADPLFDTVVENLLSNAVEHNDREEPTVSITVERGDDWVEVTVADDGPGISDRMKRTIFDHEESGTPHGLGLYLVDTLVGHYGGEVVAEDTESRGARFVVRLRRTEGELSGEEDGAGPGEEDDDHGEWS